MKKKPTKTKRKNSMAQPFPFVPLPNLDSIRIAEVDRAIIKKSKKRKAPQDLTLRNLRAMKKRIKRLEQWCEMMALDIDELYSHVKGATCRIDLRSRQISQLSVDEALKTLKGKK